MEWFTTSLLFLLVYLLTYLFIKYYWKIHWKTGVTTGGKRLPHPPSVRSLPIVGSIPYLPRNLQELHLFALEKSYSLGGVFSFKIGSMQCLSLATHEAIQEAFVKRSVDFAGRYDQYSKQFLNPHRKGIGMMNYGAHFKKYHQLSLTVLKELGFGKNIMETRITTEAEALVSSIRLFNGKPFNPKKVTALAVQNVLSTILFGKRIKSSEGSNESMWDLGLKVLGEVGYLLLLDFFPSLRYIPHFRKAVRKAVATKIKLFDLLGKEIDDILNSNRSDNFVSIYFQYDHAEFDRLQLEHTLSDIIIAGTDTSSTTLLWVILLLANNPDVQKRLREEIDSVVPRDRLPSLSDKPKMAYVEATILELMRYKTVAPTAVPHSTMCDTEVGGYFVPKNTMVIPMLYAVHMSSDVWTDPAVFRPERFLDEGGNIINKERHIAFSLGKRSCLGEQLARQELFLFFTALVQQFDIRPPEGCNHISEQEVVKGCITPLPFTVQMIPRAV